MTFNRPTAGLQENTDDSTGRAALRQQLRQEAIAGGWRPVDVPNTVTVTRTSGASEADWEVIGARLIDGRPWCRAWQWRDGGNWTFKDVAAERLGLAIPDLPSLETELARRAGLSPSEHLGLPRSGRLEHLPQAQHAEMAEVRAALPLMSDTELGEAATHVQRALELEGATWLTLSGVDRTLGEEARADAVEGAVPFDQDARMEQLRRSLLYATELNNEIRRRTEQRLHDCRDRQERIERIRRLIDQ